MVNIKVVDLFNIKFEKMEETINLELEKLQSSGNKIIDFKPIGDSLNKCSIFIMYEKV